MDSGDRDFGSSGLALLDPNTFKSSSVARMAVTAGKNGKIYILNADNLGGYMQGPGSTDRVIQTITTNEALFGGPGSYPLEGGYIYMTPVGYATSAYKFGLDGNGNPQFNLVGSSNEISAGRVGVGIPTVTSDQGREGSGILWVSGSYTRTKRLY
jgi:iron transport multicopper oxidase